MYHISDIFNKFAGTDIPAACDQSNGKRCCSVNNDCTSDCNCLTLGCIDYATRKFTWNINTKLDMKIISVCICSILYSGDSAIMRVAYMYKMQDIDDCARQVPIRLHIKITFRI